MDQRKSTLPPQALPVAPREAIPTTPQGMIDMLRAALSQKEGELADAKDMRFTVLEYYGAQSADRTARARRAGSTPKQKSAVKDTERVEEWVAMMKNQMQHGGLTGKGHIDDLVAKRRGEHAGTIKRARIKAGYK
jgi:hypothetical protein